MGNLNLTFQSNSKSEDNANKVVRMYLTRKYTSVGILLMEKDSSIITDKEYLKSWFNHGLITKMEVCFKVIIFTFLKRITYYLSMFLACFQPFIDYD
jgi:hypothetical protein